MAGDHRTTVRLSALTDRFFAAFLKSLYLSSQSLEIAWGGEKDATGPVAARS
ncbi:Autophagy-related protein 2 [Clarias magur]|uniref:Autophagy-related protein 2 n=1 Tax=Clarias magur TaxID=1594786 RepID=A0A8J4U3Q8_CLAMG|nr:Autophagy-related protein 2 [Clarias magur]